MFNLGLSEFAVIAVVAVLMIGPKELPVVMMHIGRIVKRLSYMRFAVTQQVNHFLDDSGFKDIRDNVNFEASSFNESLYDADVVSPLDAHQQAIQKAAEDVEPKTVVKKATKPKTAAKPKKKPATKAKTKATTKSTAKTTRAKKKTAKTDKDAKA